MSARAELRLVEPAPDSATARLHRLIRQREILHASFHQGFREIERLGSEAEVEDWSATAVELLNVHAGPGTLLSYLAVAHRLGGTVGLGTAAAAGRVAAQVCRLAGMRAAEATVAALPAMAGTDGAAPAADILARYATLLTVARAHPGVVQALAAVLPVLVAQTTPQSFADWAAAGLRAGGKAAEAEAWFGLRTPLSRRVLAETRGAGFAAREGALKAIFLALWGIVPVLRPRGDGLPDPAARTSLAGTVILVPAAAPKFPGAAPLPPPGDDGRGPSADPWSPGGRIGRFPLPPSPASGGGEELAALYYEAALAHVGAHARYTPARMVAAGLKPVQLALVSAVEDARVEALAMAEMPGLRRLWAPFHAALPRGAASSPGLIGQLAQALFDPALSSGDPWVEKGLALFAERRDRLTDPLMPREIGNLLGNDLGQMRLPFNVKTYAPEPAYRDDNLGLWDLGADEERPSEFHDVAEDSVRLSQRDDKPADMHRQSAGDEGDTAAGSAAAAPPAPLVFHYPEWDFAAGELRRDWVTVRESRPLPPAAAATPPAAELALARRVEAIVRQAALGQASRLRRQWEGEQIDLDAAVWAAAEIRRREAPDARIFQRRVHRQRDLATLLLIDGSESTRQVVPGTGRRVIDLETAAARVLSDAMTALGDAHAVWTFRSSGRDEVDIAVLKGFRDPSRPLAAGDPGLSTRLGAALRHGTAALDRQGALRKVLLVMTDGQPYDIDAPDPAYLREDARRAVLAARDRGIDVFCVGLGTGDAEIGKRVFGTRNYLPVARLADLPARLAMLYFRLALR